jgi:hypothetical protein
MCIAYIKYKQFLVLKGTFNPDVFQEDLKASQVYNWVQFNWHNTKSYKPV